MKKKMVYTICIVIFLLDRLVKQIIISGMDIYEKITVIPNFFDIYYVQNKGAAFSIFSGFYFIFIIIGCILVYILVKYINKNNNLDAIEKWSLGLVLGGILGNLLDRVIYKYVIDYLSFKMFGYSFAIFNIADIAIVIGCLLMIIECFGGENKKWKKISIKKN